MGPCQWLKNCARSWNVRNRFSLIPAPLRPVLGDFPGSAYRHEVKYEISARELDSVRKRLRDCMELDSHAGRAGKYRVHNLYFDTRDDDALWEKENGLEPRYKFRIRCYDNLVPGERVYDYPHLEKKIKWNGLGWKISAPLKWGEVDAILSGEWDWRDWRKSAREPDASRREGQNPELELLEEFRCRLANRDLYPKVIVDYVREPYTLPAGDVRVTLDYQLRRSLSCGQFREYDCATVPVLDAPLLRNETVIMEVKWDDALPEVKWDAALPKEKRTSKSPIKKVSHFFPPPLIQYLISSCGGKPAGSFSKYAQCRMYAPTPDEIAKETFL